MTSMNYNLDETFPFDKITLANPSSLQGGGAYFSKIKFERKPQAELINVSNLW